MSDTDIVKDADGRMDKTIAAFRHELSKIRTGRAHPSLLEHVMVKYYGSEVPMNQAGTIGVQDSRTLSITAWDKSVIPDIEKAILNSDLGLNPITAGNVIHVPLPPLTEDRRGGRRRKAQAGGGHQTVAGGHRQIPENARADQGPKS